MLWQWQTLGLLNLYGKHQIFLISIHISIINKSTQLVELYIHTHTVNAQIYKPLYPFNPQYHIHSHLSHLGKVFLLFPGHAQAAAVARYSCAAVVFRPLPGVNLHWKCFRSVSAAERLGCVSLGLLTSTCYQPKDGIEMISL